jgi:hypothetical protein
LYRGRGLLQITGRGSYAKYGQQLSIPLDASPDLAFSAAQCLEIAAAEWAASGYHGKSCNELADADDIIGVTFAVNGKAQAGYWCYRLTECTPSIGDIVCWARQDGIDYGHQNAGDYAGHCDVIVEVNPTHRGRRRNVGDSVTKRPLALGTSGFIESTTQGGELLFGVMKCRL